MALLRDPQDAEGRKRTPRRKLEKSVADAAKSN
jgi:hypothetical protein